jgi:hypothetical protein
VKPIWAVHPPTVGAAPSTVGAKLYHSRSREPHLRPVREQLVDLGARQREHARRIFELPAFARRPVVAVPPRRDIQRPPHPKVLCRLDPRVIRPRHRDRDPRDRDLQVHKAEREDADLHPALHLHGDLGPARLLVGVGGLEPKRVEAVVYPPRRESPA